MLENLSIKNFVIVDYLELNFKGGFSALTGETGAGKSILIGALSLALGQRGDSGVVRQNTDKSDISATFNVQGNEYAQEWLKKNELEVRQIGHKVKSSFRMLKMNKPYHISKWIEDFSSTINNWEELERKLVLLENECNSYILESDSFQ